MGEEPDKKHAMLESLNQQLEAVKKLQPEQSGEPKLPGDAAKAAIDFASATAVGILLGYGVDVWQDTTPWGLLGGLLLGTAAGVKMMFSDAAKAAPENKTNDNE